MKRMFWILLCLLLVGCSVFAFKNSRASTETPDYLVTRTDGAFELRVYPALRLAKTGMASDMDGSFMRLFGYITGKNERSESIAMTTPVIIDRKAGEGSMSFIVPKATLDKGVPQPKSEQVRIDDLAAGTFAVHRFKGTSRGKDEKAALEALKAWCQAQKIEVQGDPLFAYYDPPWTPAFMCRNEVLLRVKP
ncbi:MAG: heme-binding protein [Verrucomicrobiaceae bacterium]|nr:heme-binding protein [Verrucomicrobiaceae bacterium]